jgi:hypothetical protein
MFIDCLTQKWNPTIANGDLCEDLALTNAELEANEMAIQTDQAMVFNPDFTLAKIETGFRIFASEESLNEISAKRRIHGEAPRTITYFLHPQISHAGEFEPEIKLSFTRVIDSVQDSMALSMTFDRADIPMTFSSALLGALLLILQNTQQDVPLLICASSDFLLRALVKDRKKYENDLLDPNFRLLKAVVHVEREGGSNTVQES